jgi:hypothetical protein
MIASLNSHGLYSLVLPQISRPSRSVLGPTLFGATSDGGEAAVDSQVHPIHEARIV